MLALLDDQRPLVVSGVIDGLAVFDSLDAATLAKIEKFAKSDQPEVRGTALGTLALFFATKKIGRDVYVPLLPDVQRSLLSASLAERTPADYSGWVPKEFGDVRAALFPADFVARMLAAFTAQRDRFMSGDEEAGRYFVGFETAMLPISRESDKVVPFDSFPLELFLDTVGSANLKVAAQSVRTLYFQQAAACSTRPNKRYGSFRLGARLIDVKVSKRVLDRFAAVAKNDGNIAWQVDDIVNYPGPAAPFSIRDYAAGKLDITWE
jgi:hypothetical protein